MLPGKPSAAVIALFGAAILGGWLFETIGMPLGWLFGAAVVTGAGAMSGLSVSVPKVPHRAAMILIGSSVGLALSPDVASQMLGLGVVMILAAALGIAVACLLAPVFARLGGLDSATAYFCLLPGGVIEMARIGERHNADPTVIAAIHAVRVALVVGILPLGLLTLFPQAVGSVDPPALASPLHLMVAFTVGTFGGWLGHRLGLPAPWLLGAVLAVGMVAATGGITGGVPPVLLAAAQIVVGMALGARFDRARILAIPRALAVGIPIVLVIIAVMALAAFLCARALGESVPSFVLAFSIGGMAEMVLTAKLLGENVVLVAAFQTVRAVIVNASASLVWRLIRKRQQSIPSPKQDDPAS